MIEIHSVPKGKLKLLVDTLDACNRIIEIRHIHKNAYVISFDRNNIEFQPGQHIQLAPEGDYNYREYSIYSGIFDDFLEVLVKEVSNGYLSNKMGKSRPGDNLEVHGPFGQFTIKEKDFSKPFLFIASGTGIAPFHSMVCSYPNLDYTLLHGVRYCNEAYERETYEQKRYKLCTSRDENGTYFGRVTGYLTDHILDLESEVYLCGNNNMIFDAIKILSQKGFKREQIHTEVYF
jgi:ferredoxin--NADP+ reductase/benzoate/toluate 1,2-dioxygenase reductase subunit